ncbi:MAG: NADH-quinone oxidoreductase subunit J [Opitutales bacterium]|nr:NADH-quinone oxidoreductase subunit J [Opitutales bacterium]MDG1354858.1 NADH-quinone oxidoreductase subunit J [Opitutales bacterium]
MNAVDLLFWLFAVLSVGGGLFMVFSRHPVSAAMFMIVSLVGVAALFVLLESFFLAILQVLVYAGAVMVLFLFIIMLLDVGPEAGKRKLSHFKTGIFGILATFLLVGILLILGNSYDSLALDQSIWPELSESKDGGASQGLPFSTKVSSFGYGLMTKYMLPIQVSGFMLLAAMVGVIILSKKTPAREDVK